jgi:hypothetical protein
MSRIRLDVAGAHFAGLVDAQVERLGRVGVHLERDLLQVEDDVGRVLDHAGIGENSWSTPSILTAVTAAPSIEESSTRRSALPTVVPKPRSNGCA